MKILYNNLSWKNWFLMIFRCRLRPCIHITIQVDKFSFHERDIYSRRVNSWTVPVLSRKNSQIFLKREACLSVSFDPHSFPRKQVKACSWKALTCSCLGPRMISVPPYKHSVSSKDSQVLLNEIQNSQHATLGPAWNPYTQQAAAKNYLLGSAKGKGRFEILGWHRAAGSHLCPLLLPSLETALRKPRN